MRFLRVSGVSAKENSVIAFQERVPIEIVHESLRPFAEFTAS